MSSRRQSLGALRVAEVDLQHMTALEWQRFLAPCVPLTSPRPTAHSHTPSTPPPHLAAVCQNSRGGVCSGGQRAELMGGVGREQR
jgi:hypothetical protein